MERDKAFDKIKKCLALASSSNPHEAAAAMRQAQKLMAEHGLSGMDVELDDFSERKAHAKSNLLTSWETLLARSVADAFGCTLYIKKEFQRLFMANPVRVTYWVFVGSGPAPEVATYAFRVLQRQCVKDRLAHVKQQPKRLKSSTRIARGDAFALAWVDSVRELLDRFAGTERHADLLVQYMAHNHPDLKPANIKSRELNRHVRDDSYAQGHQAGKNAKLRRGVAAGKKQELLS